LLPQFCRLFARPLIAGVGRHKFAHARRLFIGPGNDFLKMPFEKITTPRLKLRPFRFSDVSQVYAYLQEPGMARFLEGSSQPPT